MSLTLRDMKLVLSGTFGDIDAEDARWDLKARGAYVTTSVTKSTAVLIAGDNPEKKHLKGAEKHGTPMLDVAGLQALLDGASVEEALSGSSAGDKLSDLDGWKVAVDGTFADTTHAALVSALEKRGAKVVRKASKSCELLVVGVDPSAAGVDAMDAGVPFLPADEVKELLGGAPISDFIGPSSGMVADPESEVSRILEAVHSELVSLSLGEPWDEMLTLTLKTSGRVIAELRDLGGTPTHDHVRRVLQRQSWPATDHDIQTVHKLDYQ